MKRIFLMLLGAAFVMGLNAQETYTKNRVVEDGGTGPYKAIMVEEPSLEAHTIFRPADLSKFGKKNPLPILSSARRTRCPSWFGVTAPAPTHLGSIRIS